MPQLTRKKLDLKDLPVLPMTLVEIIRVIEKGEDSEVKDLAEVIDRDPPLAVKIRTYVNSAFVGRRVKAKNTVEAINTLGFNKIWPIALTMNFYEFINGGKGLFDPRRFWKHSIQVATAAVRIAEKVGFADLGSAFFCGLVHDIGILVLERNFPKEMEDVWTDLGGEDELAEKEQEAFGWDHLEAGDSYLEERGFPDSMRVAVRHHHEFQMEDDTEEGFTLSRIIVLAHLVSHYSIEGRQASRLVNSEKVIDLCQKCGLRRLDLLAIEALLIPETIRQCQYMDRDIGSLEELMADARATLYQGCMSMADELQLRFSQLKPQLDNTQFKTAVDRAVKLFCSTSLDTTAVEAEMRLGEEVGQPGKESTLDRLNEFMAGRYEAMRELLEMSPRELVKTFGGLKSKDVQEASPTAGAIAFAKPEMVKGSYEIMILYTTDRKQKEVASGKQTFSNQPSGGGDPHYGMAMASVPDLAQRNPSKVYPTWHRVASDSRFCKIKKMFKGQSDIFIDALGKVLDPSAERRVMVFVPGYNATFDQSLLLTARLTYELNYHGLPLVYSWPSAGTFSGYGKDEQQVMTSTNHLSGLLRMILAQGKGIKVDLIACGLGGGILAGALASLKKDAKPEVKNSLGQVVFVAPDVEQGHFKNMVVRFRHKVDGVTLYSSSLDWGLSTSRLFKSHRRAGNTGDGLVLVEGVETIDASLSDIDFEAQAGNGKGLGILADLASLLKNPGSPGDRFGMKRCTSANHLYWVFEPE